MSSEYSSQLSRLLDLVDFNGVMTPANRSFSKTNSYKIDALRKSLCTAVSAVSTVPDVAAVPG